MDYVGQYDQAFAVLAEANRQMRRVLEDAGQGFDAAALRTQGLVRVVTGRFAKREE